MKNYFKGIPNLPPKTPLGGKMSSKIIKARQSALQIYLELLLDDTQTRKANPLICFLSEEAINFMDIQSDSEEPESTPKRKKKKRKSTTETKTTRKKGRKRKTSKEDHVEQKDEDNDNENDIKEENEENKDEEDDKVDHKSILQVSMDNFSSCEDLSILIVSLF